MRSIDEYAALNGAAVRADRQRKALARRRVARRLVEDYLEAMGGVNNGHMVTGHERKLIKAIEQALAREAAR